MRPFFHFRRCMYPFRGTIGIFKFYESIRRKARPQRQHRLQYSATVAPKEPEMKCSTLDDLGGEIERDLAQVVQARMYSTDAQHSRFAPLHSDDNKETTEPVTGAYSGCTKRGSKDAKASAVYVYTISYFHRRRAYLKQQPAVNRERPPIHSRCGSAIMRTRGCSHGGTSFFSSYYTRHIFYICVFSVCRGVPQRGAPGGGQV